MIERCPCLNSPNLWICHCTQQIGLCRFENREMQILLDYPGESNIITRILKWGKGDKRVKGNMAVETRPEWCNVRINSTDHCWLWWCKQVMSQGMWQHPEAKKCKKINPTIEPQKKKKCSSANTLILAHCDLFWTSDLQDSKIINLCNFKPPHLW